MKVTTKPKGQTIIEFTLMLPVILAVLYIPADFGISLFVAHLTQNAVREGARIGSSLPRCGSEPCVQDVGFEEPCPGSNAVVSAVCARLPPLLRPVEGSSAVEVAAGLTSGPACMRSVKVEVMGTYNFFLYQLLGLLGFSVPDSIEITRATEMRWDLQPLTAGDPSDPTTVCP